MKFEIIKSNIVNISADAIVLPANEMLKEGSGTSTAIFDAAGRKQLTAACKKIGKCEVGSAVPTLAFNLDAKYIIHAVLSRWIDGEHSEYDLLSSAYLSSLRIADVMGCSSIAFPLLASGNNGYDPKLAFQIAKDSIESYEGTNLKKIILVLFDTQITKYVKEQGYEVLEIPVDLKKEQRKQAKKDKNPKIIDAGKEVAQQLLDAGIKMAMDYLKDEKNRQEIIKAGIKIAKHTIKIMQMAMK